MVRVRVRDDPGREDVVVGASEAAPESAPEQGAAEEPFNPPPCPRHGELPLGPPVDPPPEVFESAEPSPAPPGPFSGCRLTDLDASSTGEAVRPASWRVRHIALAAVVCCGARGSIPRQWRMARQSM